MPVVIEIPHGTPACDELVRFREEHLRRPLGLSYDAEQLAGEADQLHFALVDDKLLLGCLLAAPVGGGTFKLRQMAIAAAFRGQGYGRQLVECVEQELRARGATELVLNAREAAIGFYKRLGYEAFGEPFVEVTIPHRAMRKRLES